VQTVAFDVNVHARAKERDLILGNVQPGDRIWGFASDGQAVWEDQPNSGIMSNGLTLARMVTMDKSYTEKYPDLVRQGGSYTGKFMAGFRPAGLDGMTIDEALTSPTRQWAILIKFLIDLLKEEHALHLLHGITMNTGGGATKVLHLGTGGIWYQKTMPFPPPIFRLVQSESGEDWCDMYRNFNCGIGIDIVGDEGLRPVLEWLARETRVPVHDLDFVMCAWVLVHIF
jgi:phosphoribosylformylglycinamidine cyclo-ligase